MDTTLVTPGDPPAAGPSSAYLVCATPRTGSYLLCDLLTRTGLAGRPTEYFSAGYQAYWSPRWGVSDYADYLRRVQAVATTPNGVFGVKAHPRQFRYFARQACGRASLSSLERRRAAEAWLPGCRYVWLRRRDDHRQAVSWAKSMQTNIWWDAAQAPAPFDEPTPEALRFDLGLLRGALARMRLEDRMWGEYFEASGVEPMIVWYEDLAADPVAVLGAVLAFLGMPAAPRGDHLTPSTSFRRQADATTERWLSRFTALESVRRDANLRSARRLEVDHPDLIVTSGRFDRPPDWDESRHSLFAIGSYSGPFKPDYSLRTRGALDVTPAPDLRFTLDPAHASADGPVDIPVTGAAFGGLPGPAVSLATSGTELAIVLSAHLGADRVGVLEPDDRSRIRNGSDKDTTRVLTLVPDAAVRHGHELDVTGFLQLPRRPHWEREGVTRLRIAIVGRAAQPGWCRSLAGAINALTRHSAWWVRAGSSAVDDESVLSGADVVFAVDGGVWPARHPDRAVIAVTSDLAVRQPGLELRGSDGRIDSAPWPLDWWIARHRPLAKPATLLVYVVANDDPTPDHDPTTTAQRIRASVGSGVTVLAGSPSNPGHDPELRRAAHVVVDLAPDGFSVDSLCGLAHASVVVNRVTARSGKLDTAWFGPDAMPPLVCSTESDVGFAVRMLLNDPALTALGRAGRDWVRRRWSFTEQWDTYWMPAITQALASAHNSEDR